MGYYLRTTRSGRQELVRSNSYSHHPRHHKCFDDCAGKSCDEWNNLVEQNRNYRELHLSDAREISTLKSNLQAVNTENHRLRTFNQQAIDETFALRRSVSEYEGQANQFKRRIKTLTGDVKKADDRTHHLEKENRALVARDKDADHQIADLTDRIQEWKTSYDELKLRFDQMRAERDGCRRLIRDQTDTIRRLQDLLDRNRIYYR